MQDTRYAAYHARRAAARLPLSPREQMQRDAAQAMRSSLAAVDQASSMNALASVDGGYHSATDMSGWATTWHHGVRDAAADTLPHLRMLRGQARDLSRNNAIGASAISTNVLRAVGTGLALSAQPNRFILGWTEDQARQWVQRTHPEWRMFADSPTCDWRGQSSFDDLCDLVCRTMLDSGDGFTVLPDAPERTPMQPYRLRLQVIEADRVGNPGNDADSPTVSGGIKFKDGRPVAAFVYDTHPGAINWTGDASLFKGQWIDFVGRSGRRRILHHFKLLRPEQPRGVPYLAPVMGLFKQLGTYADAEIKAAIVAAFHTVFIESDLGTGPAPVYGLGPDGAAGGANADEVALGAGAIIGLAKGERANIHAPGRPNPQFGPFVQSVLDQLGAGTLIGAEMLLKKYNTSYVAARAAFLDAWKHLLDVRTRVIRTLCQPVYETWLAEAVAIGRIDAPGFFTDPLRRWAFTRALWQGDSQGSINPKDEVAAYAAAVEARLMSRERAEWELFGTDWQETYDTKLAEHKRLVADDMLPVPKAGAAAPPPAGGDDKEPA
jgi:lambda family phage portal protein